MAMDALAAARLPLRPAGPRPFDRRLDRLSDLGARAAIGALFVLLAHRIALDVWETGRATGVLLLASELLVAILVVVRRPAAALDRSAGARVVTLLSILGAPLVVPGGAPWVPDAVTASLSGAGLALVIAGKITLGRSFGLIPADRGMVTSGVYGVVRHPIYAGYLVTHLGFVLQHPAPWNLLVLGLADVALMVRAAYEERLLGRDPAYLRYRRRVRWRIVPGVY